VRRDTRAIANQSGGGAQFRNVVRDIGTRDSSRTHRWPVPGISQAIIEADLAMASKPFATRRSARSGRSTGSANLRSETNPTPTAPKERSFFTNDSAALKGFPSSGAFAMACHASRDSRRAWHEKKTDAGRVYPRRQTMRSTPRWRTQEAGNSRAPAGGNGLRRQPGRPRHIPRPLCSCTARIARHWAFEVRARPWVERW